MDYFLTMIGFNKKKDEVWLLKLDKHLKVYLLNNKLPFLIEHNGNVFPTIMGAKMLEEYYPQVIVDEGAVPHILNGADLMAPGILRVSLRENDIVFIKSLDDSIIAIGKFVKDFRGALASKHGKVAENLHYMNDKLYRLLASKYGK